MVGEEEQPRDYAEMQNGANNKHEGSTDNRRILTVQAYQCKLKAGTGASAGTNARKCNGTQTLDGCTHKTLLGIKEHRQR